jgi:serine/threonine protein kinase
VDDFTTTCRSSIYQLSFPVDVWSAGIIAAGLYNLPRTKVLKSMLFSDSHQPYGCQAQRIVKSIEEFRTKPKLSPDAVKSANGIEPLIREYIIDGRNKSSVGGSISLTRVFQDANSEFQSIVMWMLRVDPGMRLTAKDAVVRLLHLEAYMDAHNLTDM